MRRAAPALLLALALALLAGCGGGSDAAETSAAAGEASATRAEALAKTQRAARARAARRARAEQRVRAAQRRHSSAGSAELHGPAPTPSGPLPNEGTKKVAPGVPTAKGGDNSIQRFGVESPSADRVAATRALKAYLDARAAGDWVGACARISAGLKAEFSQFGQQSSAQGKSPGCAEVLRTLTAEVPASALRTAAAIHVLSMRVKGSAAYLVYRNGEGTPSAIPMDQEGGAWKVTGLDGSALVLGSASAY